MKSAIIKKVSIGLLSILFSTSLVSGAAGDTTRISIAMDGTEGNNDSYTPSMSADGRYVAFSSYSTNLVTGDSNRQRDIFLYDTQTGTMTRVSIASDGTEGNNDSAYPSISADGRYVAFRSDASNLVTGDNNGASDIFVHDTETNTTTRVSVATDGTEGNDNSHNPSISADGHYVAFYSGATTLVTGDDNGALDIFVHNTQTGTTTRVSVATDGTEGDSVSYAPSISADGRYVAFRSSSTNLVTGDDNGASDIFVHDTETNTTTRVSIATNGTEGDSSGSYSPSISADGRYVAFRSSSTNLVTGDNNSHWDIFVHDTQTGTTTRVSVATDGTEGDADSFFPSISADGRYVAFHSYAANLVTEDGNDKGDIFVHDTQTGTTTRVNIATDGTEGDQNSGSPSISADGYYVAFSSSATNLVTGDSNNRGDIFVHQYLSNVNTGGGCSYNPDSKGFDLMFGLILLLGLLYPIRSRFLH